MKRFFRTAIAVAALLTLLFCLSALAEDAQEVTKSLKFKLSEGSASDIRDDSEKTAWKPTNGKGEMRVKLPEGTRYFHLAWSLEPTDYTVTEYDENGTVIATHTPQTDPCPCLRMLYVLNEQTRYVFVDFDQTNQGVARVQAFTDGTLPSTVIKWEKGPEKCDLMVFSTHMDDEWLWFGAIIPYYQLVQHKNVQVVYMANCGRRRYGEALSAIASTGVTNYPLFVGLKDERIDSFNQSVEDWGGKEKVLGIFVEIIRRYKPDVILTHDWNGEYGHNQHKITSRVMEYAINAAADPAQYPESYAKYGAWQVSKLYRHLEDDQVIQFDWHVAYEEFGGRTGLEVATDAMNQNKSQLEYYQVQDHGKYDNTLFGLSWTNVGDDVEHADLFENIVSTAVTASVPEEPAGTEPPDTTGIVLMNPLVSGETDDTEETPLPTFVPSADETSDVEDVSAEPAPTVGVYVPQRVDEKKSSPVPAILLSLGAVVALGGGGTFYYLKRRKAHSRVTRRRPGARR